MSSPRVFQRSAWPADFCCRARDGELRWSDASTQAWHRRKQILAILHGTEDGIFAEKNSKEGHEDGTLEVCCWKLSWNQWSRTSDLELEGENPYPRRWALWIISPCSSRIALMNWTSHIDASTATRRPASVSTLTRRPAGSRRFHSPLTPMSILLSSQALAAQKIFPSKLG